MASGALWLHQAWSGDMAAAPLYTPKGVPPSVFGYWFPSDGRGPINNDMLSLVNGGKNPVLAHLFLNHVLDVQQAFINYEYIYYQQPLSGDDAGPRWSSADLVPPNLRNTLVEERPVQDRAGRRAVERRDRLYPQWQTAWAAVRSR